MVKASFSVSVSIIKRLPSKSTVASNCRFSSVVSINENAKARLVRSRLSLPNGLRMVRAEILWVTPRRMRAKALMLWLARIWVGVQADSLEFISRLKRRTAADLRAIFCWSITGARLPVMRANRERRREPKRNDERSMKANSLANEFERNQSSGFRQRTMIWVI